MRDGGADEEKPGVGDESGDIEGDEVGDDVDDEEDETIIAPRGEPGMLGGRGRVKSERVALLIH